MESAHLELNTVELSVSEDFKHVSELSSLELALIGGGVGEVIIG